MKKIISVKNISKIYNTADGKIYALNNVSFDIDGGELVAIVGDSGSGKSTLMNILGCLDFPDKGSYFLNGKDISKLKEKALSRIRNKTIGFVFQSFNLINGLTAKENVELPLVYRKIKKSERRRRAEDALSKVGLSERQNHTPGQLSGGQRQRVAVARAICIEPKIIFADEPTGNLDKKSRDSVMDILIRLNKEGKTVVIITHDPEIAEICKRRINISDGQIV